MLYKKSTSTSSSPPPPPSAPANSSNDFLKRFMDSKGNLNGLISSYGGWDSFGTALRNWLSSQNGSLPSLPPMGSPSAPPVAPPAPPQPAQGTPYMPPGLNPKAYEQVQMGWGMNPGMKFPWLR